MISAPNVSERIEGDAVITMGYDNFREARRIANNLERDLNLGCVFVSIIYEGESIYDGDKEEK